MKQVVCLFLITLLSPPTVYGGWTQDWFDSSTKSGSGSFQGQQRGYYSGGHFSARFTMTNDPVVTIQMPRIAAGCGGIDIFKGGLSYLDADYLVDKLQNAIQAAPAIAFDIAMKVMSKELSDTMTNFEAIINDLNSLSMDDCALAKKLATPVGNYLGEQAATSANLGVVDQTVSAKLATARGWYDQSVQQQANDDKPVEDSRDLITECSAGLKGLFATGLLLDNVADEVGLDGYQDIIRGFAGDVEIKMDAEDKTILGIPVPPCDDNDRFSIDGFVNGQAYKKTDATSASCAQDLAGGLEQLVEASLTSIATKMKASPAAALTAAEQQFIDTSPVPVFLILRDAVMAENETVTIEVMREVISYAYAWHMVNNMYQYSEQLFIDADRIIKTPKATGPNCDKSVFASVMSAYDKLRYVLRDLREDARDSYFKRTQEIESHIVFIQSQMEQSKKIRQQNATDHQEE